MGFRVLLILAAALLQATLLFGAVRENVKLRVVAAPHGTEAEKEKRVRAEAVVDRINTSEQLKVIALQLLEQLKGSYPNCRSYTIVLSNDARMMAIGRYLAVATSEGGKTVVTGGIPTNMDIRAMKASRVEVRMPDSLGMQVAYDVALLKKESVKRGQPLTDDTAYALVAKKRKLQAAYVRQIDQGITQYYKAFAGKPF